MRNKNVVKMGALLVGIMLAVVTLMAVAVFAMVPAASNFTNVLLLTMVLMQLLTVSVLVHIHDVLAGDVKRRR